MVRHQLKINDRVGVHAPVAQLKKILVEVLERYGGRLDKRTTETSLVFVSDRSMANLNRMYRGKRGTTNVLSFSFVRPPNKIGAGEPLLLGEVLISPQQAARAAKIHKHALQAELAALFVHGLLHVIRFDHETTPRAARAMQEAENAVIGAIPALRKSLKGRGLIVRELVYPR